MNKQEVNGRDTRSRIKKYILKRYKFCYIYIMKCKNCNRNTSNPKFCSRSCAATYTNKNSPPKRKRTKLCENENCDNKILSNRKYCIGCRKPCISPDMSLREAMYIDGRLHRSSLYAKVRARARSACREKDKICCKCGYDKHVEVCHIKPISSFSENTLISEVNSLDNLMLLCPNCHWEFDNL